MTHIYPFTEFLWLYAAFIMLIAAVLYSSLRLFHRESHTVSIAEASRSAVGWFLFALLFNGALYWFTFHRVSVHPEIAGIRGVTPDALAFSTALEFLSGYLVEKALAVDNLFVFIVIFRFFAIPDALQHRVLFYGLFGAIVMRAIFISIGSVVMSIHWIVVLFGFFLIYQGISVLRGKNADLDPEHNVVLKFLKRWLPVSRNLDGQNFFTVENGKKLVTPLFVVLVFIEITDVIFAFDSVPAIFGLTQEPLVVFTSNIFAVIDLRALYFLLAAFIHKFHYLNVGLSFVLIFIGTKMAVLDSYFGGKFPTGYSLGIVATLLVGSIVISLLRPEEVKKS